MHYGVGVFPARPRKPRDKVFQQILQPRISTSSAFAAAIFCHSSISSTVDSRSRNDAASSKRISDACSMRARSTRQVSMPALTASRGKFGQSRDQVGEHQRPYWNAKT